MHLSKNRYKTFIKKAVIYLHLELYYYIMKLKVLTTFGGEWNMMKNGSKTLRMLLICTAICLLISSACYANTKWVTITGTDFVLDSFNGVDAVYTSEKNDAADEKYSCAAYVKKYYKQIYNTGVYNLIDEGPPVVRDNGVAFKRVNEPQQGDIIFWPVSTNGNNHSAIVKSVDGKTITLIEQNYKTGVIAAVGRTVTYPSDKFQIYRLTGDFTENKPVGGNQDRTEIGSNQAIYMTMDEFSISVICEEFRFGPIVGVSGSAQNADQKIDSSLDAASYELRSDTYFCFTLNNENIKGWYLNNDKWEEIQSGKEVTASRAYFTIYEKEIQQPTSDAFDEESTTVFQNGTVDSLPKAPVIPETNVQFYDVPKGHWAYDSVQKCVGMGLFSGYEDGSFQPDRILTRAEFTVLLAKASNWEVSPALTSRFLDVSINDWYSGYVAYGSSYLSGSGNYFYPMKGASREDVCSAMIKLLNFQSLAVDLSSLNAFKDQIQIKTENREAVAFALSIGLIGGFEDGTFRPRDSITRAQAAVLFAKVY